MARGRRSNCQPASRFRTFWYAALTAPGAGPAQTDHRINAASTGTTSQVLNAPLAPSGKPGVLSDAQLDEICTTLRAWLLLPNGSDGYRTAEITLSSIHTDALSATTMMSHAVPKLYSIGEAVDVTGWLAGYNFQRAWSFGWAAAQAIIVELSAVFSSKANICSGALSILKQ